MMYTKEIPSWYNEKHRGITKPLTKSILKITMQLKLFNSSKFVKLTCVVKQLIPLLLSLAWTLLYNITLGIYFYKTSAYSIECR